MTAFGAQLEPQPENSSPGEKKDQEKDFFLSNSYVHPETDAMTRIQPLDGDVAKLSLQ